jgi:hypothetical protein
MLTVERYNELHIPLDEGLDRPIENVLQIPIAEAIGSYIEAASGTRKDTTRPPGFFIARSDLKKIKSFTDYADALPTDLNQIKRYLGYSGNALPGLALGDIQSLHKDAKKLADFWGDIEVLMKQVASELIVFSVDLKTNGDLIINLIKNLEGYKEYTLTVGNLQAVQLPDIKLRDEDQASLQGLLALSTELLDIVQGYQRNATEVKKRIEYFLIALMELKDSIAHASHAAANHALAHDVSEYVMQLQRLNAQIDELRRTYETYSRYTWVGAWWGPVGLIVSASIYGSEAAAVRQEQDEVFKQKKQLEDNIKQTETVMGAMTELQTKLQQFELLSLEAIGGAKNIEDIWRLINSYITASMAQMQKNNNATPLLTFESRLTSMIKHWEAISEQARKVIEPSDEAHQTRADLSH